MMKIGIIRDWHRFRHATFARNLENVDLSQYGVVVDEPDAPVGSRQNPTHQRIAIFAIGAALEG